MRRVLRSCAWLILLLASSPDVDAQEYYFIKAKHSGKCLHQHGGIRGNGARITQWDCVHEPNVKLQKIPAGGDTFFLRFAHSGQCVHLHGGYSANGTAISQWDCIDLPNVKWREAPAGEGYVYLRSVATNKCIHQHGGTQGNGDRITQWDCVDEPNVKWLFEPTSAPPSPSPPPSPRPPTPRPSLSPQPTTGSLLVNLGFGAGYRGCAYQCTGSGTVTVSSATGDTRSQDYGFSGVCSGSSPACSRGVTFSQLPAGTWRIQDSSGATCQKQISGGQFASVTIRTDNRTCQ